MSNGDKATATIVVGVDGSEQSVRALLWAAEEAKLRGTSLHTVQAWQPLGGAWASPAGAAPASAWSHEDYVAETLSSLDEFVSATLTDYADVHVRKSVGVGNPVEVLIHTAEQDDAQMLVVGSRGQGGFKRLLLGSVSEQCATHAHCPVVIIHPEPK